MLSVGVRVFGFRDAKAIQHPCAKAATLSTPKDPRMTQGKQQLEHDSGVHYSTTILKNTSA